MQIHGSDSLFRLPPASAPAAARPADAPRRTEAPAPSAAAEVGAAAPEQAPRAPHGATLWEVLTEEERAFFAQQSALGPITYRPGARKQVTPQAAPTGQRIDVKG